MTQKVWTGSPSNPSSWLPRHTLHPAGFFTSASTAEKFIATSPSLLINIKSSSRPNPKAATSSVTSEIAFPTKDYLAAKRLRRSDQDGVRRTLTIKGGERLMKLNDLRRLKCQESEFFHDFCQLRLKIPHSS